MGARKARRRRPTEFNLEWQLDQVSYSRHLPVAVRIGLYKILFYFEAYVHESMIFFANTTFIWALHHTHYCAIYCCPSTPRYCNIYRTLLSKTISCKGQRESRE